MVQFNLPKNSKILKGQYFKDKIGSSNLKIVHVYRWDPEKNENPREDTFEVNLDTCGNKVLDILNKIKNEIDSSLTFRRSCAHGVCGSCAMNIDGINTLSCMKSHKDIKGDIRIFPLPHLKVVKDLVADLSTLYKQYEFQPEPNVFRREATRSLHEHLQTRNAKQRHRETERHHHVRPAFQLDIEPKKSESLVQCVVRPSWREWHRKRRRSELRRTFMPD